LEWRFQLLTTFPVRWQDLAALSPGADALVRSYLIDAWLPLGEATEGLNKNGWFVDVVLVF